jgi:hypothetical protein
MLSVATKAGWTPPVYSMVATFVSIPIAVLFLLGGNYINAVSGEVKNVKFAVPHCPNNVVGTRNNLLVDQLYDHP